MALENLVGRGLIQRKAPDPRRVTGWLARSRKDLHTASTVLAAVDPERAMAIAYEAGYRACAGILDLEGYRLTGQPAITAPRSMVRRRSWARANDRSCDGSIAPGGFATMRSTVTSGRSAKRSSSSC